MTGRANDREIIQALGFQNAVYFTNWGIYARDYQPVSLPTSQVNQVIYGFANLRQNGVVYSSDPYADIEKRYARETWDYVGTNAHGCVRQLYLLKMNNRYLKVLLSIGGWTYSRNFTAASSTPATRATFSKSAVSIMKDWGFDGLDIDWEYPENENEADNMVLLLQAVREELDSYSAKYGKGYHFLLTAAVPAGPLNYRRMKLGQMVPLLDYFNLMAYDYAGSWGMTSAHQANLYASSSNPASTPFSAHSAISDYLEAGVPAAKIVLGIPLYGRSFENTGGIGRAYKGIGQGSWEPGVWDYKVLLRPGAVEQYDVEAAATYSYDIESQELVSYDTVYMIQTKIEYLQARGLAGTMFWEASGDRANIGSLIAASFESQGGEDRLDRSPNCLRYPNSRYDNIRDNAI
ncbi:chitinase [Xylariomycetidae sp. FL2044]|nr:chitinase [Xylariomycetidae sp. FL2044]